MHTQTTHTHAHTHTHVNVRTQPTSTHQDAWQRLRDEGVEVLTLGDFGHDSVAGLRRQFVLQMKTLGNVVRAAAVSREC